MNVANISNRVYYLGVNDRRTAQFEALWPIPHGVSYNAYLINDEHPALVDTVEISFCREYISKIKSVLKDKAPEYLIVNHMEPDHSGSIPILLEVYPSLKIIGNRQTVEMIKGFNRSIDESRLQVVADGEVISLGESSLKFILTPMVHWPETMMTYLDTDKTLFSGDAFGTFGALNGGVVDNDIDFDQYKDEMYRYYACIVGKYGKFVLRAIDKVKSSGIEIERICTTHGPVWQDNATKVISIYEKLAKYEANKGVVIAYASMYGNTTEAANILASELSRLGIEEVRMFDLSVSNMSYILADIFKFNGLVVMSPTYSMELFPKAEALMKALLTREVKNRIFATFTSYTWAPGVALKKMTEYAEKLGWTPTAQAEMKQSVSSQTYDDLKQMAAAIASNL